ncbi:MAG: CRISPR-associated protein Csm7 [Magnetococcales bacterium]|nr:CRISPR-associated protein Csm7 [Magnetococcales bacterium]
MKSLRVTLRPVTAFITPLHGDTLFGQLCWALRHRLGEAWLEQALNGYGQGQPFLVVSDAFPAGYWPRPALPPLPGSVHDKVAKKKVWLPRQEWRKPLQAWLSDSCNEQEAFGLEKEKRPPLRPLPRSRNSINRISGTTGEEGFAPYSLEQIWFPVGSRLEVWLLHDERVETAQVRQALWDVGQSGFGKKASSGMGYFELLEEPQEESLPAHQGSNSWLSLGFCLPHGGEWDAKHSFYQVFTRFGRHGGQAALTGQPFKKPLLLTRAGGLFSPRQFQPRQWIGQGIGGDGLLSRCIPETVQQGYAPVVGLLVDWESFNHG